MKLSEYFNQLKDFIELHPECLDMDVVYSCDDEGNSYQKVYYGPSVGILEDTDFICEDQLEDWDRDLEDLNSVCIN
jgi:hypothetical protein